MSESNNDNRRTRRPQLKKQPPLKKQPRLRRSGSDSLSSSLNLPRTAAQRRRRNKMPALPLNAMLGVVTSSRWISFAILLLIGYALTIVGTRTDFYLRYIPVEGAVSIDPAEVIAASGLAGQHIFAADPNLAADQIAAIPGIISAAVDLEWPNQINITIEEDSPIALWQTPTQSFWINQELEILPSRGESGGLLHIQADSTAGLLGVSVIEPEETELEAAENGETAAPPPVEYTTGAIPEDLLIGAFMLQNLQPNGTTLTALNYDPNHGLSFEDSRGWTVYMGTGSDMAQKLSIYRALVADLQARGITPEYVSISNKDKPYYMEAR